jgi:DNA-binding transcriptional LysR family regulator
MDRLETLGIFVEVAERGGFAAAARRLRRSPATVTRGIAQLERELGAQLLRRTTRKVGMTEIGERYLEACRRILADVEGARQLAAGERAVARGVLAVTAPVVFGRLHVRPIVSAFLARHREVSARLAFVDRIVDLVDEGFDVAVRIGALPDSSLIAARVGEVRRIACASPAYLARQRTPREAADLARHDLIAFSQVTPNEWWPFARRRVALRPRLTVNTADAALDAALAGEGIACVLSYQADADLRAGRLVRILQKLEPEPVPVQLVYPAGSVLSAKVRAFVELAVPRLQKALARAA